MKQNKGAGRLGAIMAAPRARLLAGLFVAVVGAGQLSACVPLVAGAAAGVGGLAVLDRRTIGAQTEDQSIELRSSSKLSEALPKGQSVSVTSYNRKVLLTGFVSDEALRAKAEAAVATVPNIASLHNEIEIGFRPSLVTSTNDIALTARIKAAILDARDLQSNAFKVVTEGGTAYLMGIVTQREGDRAAQVVSMVGGVRRVVTLFEYVSETELGNLYKAAPRQESR